MLKFFAIPLLFLVSIASSCASIQIRDTVKNDSLTIMDGDWVIYHLHGENKSRQGLVKSISQDSLQIGKRHFPIVQLFFIRALTNAAFLSNVFLISVETFGYSVVALTGVLIAGTLLTIPKEDRKRQALFLSYFSIPGLVVFLVARNWRAYINDSHSLNLDNSVVNYCPS